MQRNGAGTGCPGVARRHRGIEREYLHCRAAYGAGGKKGRLANKVKRQRKVSKLAAKGMPKAHIAKKLGVSPITVSKDLQDAKKE